MVRLNVGGIEHVTTVGTLVSCGTGSVLHDIGVKWKESHEQSAPVYLDRCGEIFSHVLQYVRTMRVGVPVLPKSPELRLALTVEARAFRMQNLLLALRKVDDDLRGIIIVVGKLVTIRGAGGVVEKQKGKFSVNATKNVNTADVQCLRGLDEEVIGKNFDDRVTDVIREICRVTNYLLRNTSASDVAMPAGTKSDYPWDKSLHVHSITLTFAPPDS